METSANKTPVVSSLTARVVSARMDKTASVEMSRTVKHPVYGKFLRRRTKLLAHDEANECRIGDVVTISPCRPLSKCKSWRVTAIVERAAGTADRDGAENAEELAP
ncbi:MAG: 30S ribosomal protein S17 [Gammaproteobacteria bacterium]